MMRRTFLKAIGIIPGVSAITEKLDIDELHFADFKLHENTSASPTRFEIVRKSTGDVVWTDDRL